jgi:hypothetical protein
MRQSVCLHSGKTTSRSAHDVTVVRILEQSGECAAWICSYVCACGYLRFIATVTGDTVFWDVTPCSFVLLPF